jgi:hypothetical protein
LGQQYSYEDYTKFYEQHFASLKTKNSFLLSEPIEIVTKEADEENIPETEEPTTSKAETLILQPEKQQTVKQDSQKKKSEPQKTATPKADTKKNETKKTETNKKPAKQPVKQIDLDDEYYDLEGF